MVWKPEYYFRLLYLYCKDRDFADEALVKLYKINPLIHLWLPLLKEILNCLCVEKLKKTVWKYY